MAQSLIGKGRVFKSDMSSFEAGETIECSKIYLGVFEGQTRGLKPLLEFKDFAIFDKENPDNLNVLSDLEKDIIYIDDLPSGFPLKGNKADWEFYDNFFKEKKLY